MDDYLTVEKYAAEEYIVNKSRFIGYCKPVSSADEAVEFISEIRAKHRDATHNVYAYCIRSPEYSRYSDDGEPQGTAGQPTLDVIKKNSLTDVCVVVTRYFGGILLGAGGLVRAYSHTASLAVNAACPVRMALCDVFEVNTDYSRFERVQKLILECGGIIEDTQYADSVKISFRLHCADSAKMCEKLTDMSNGSLRAEKTGEKYDICARKE